MLRAKQIGFSIDEMEQVTEGDILDMIVEHGNDGEEYEEVATQADFDSAFGG